MPIVKNCAWCGKEIKVSPSKNSINNFCNKDCYSNFHRAEKKKNKCEVCGKLFEIKNNSNANRFCGRECYNFFHNIKDKERTCPTCGKNFQAKTSEDKYCSRECYNKNRNMPKGKDHWNWQGGISLIEDNRDSHEYKIWRKQVYERDGYCCTKCGSKIKLNAHHIKSWKKYPALRYNVDNGVTLCEKCHIKYHQENGYNED